MYVRNFEHVFFQHNCMIELDSQLPPQKSDNYNFLRSTGLGNAHFIKRHCLFKSNVVQYSQDYLHKFFLSYSSKLKYFTMEVPVPDEGFSNADITSEVDEQLANVLQKLKNDKLIENTIIRIYSYQNEPEVLRTKFRFGDSQAGQVEAQNPILLEIMPKRWQEKFGKFTQMNQGKLVTLKDVMSADIDLMSDKNTSSKSSYFNSELKKGRKCDAVMSNTQLGKEVDCYCN